MKKHPQNQTEPQPIQQDLDREHMQVDVLDYDNYAVLHYHNHGMTFRTLVLDLNKNIIQDELVAYNHDGKPLQNVVFAPDHTTILGKREHLENHGFKDYRLVNNALILTQMCVNEWLSAQKLKSSYYNAENQLVYYDIYEEENAEIGMICMGHFDINHQPFGWDNPPDAVKALLSYSDY